MAAVYSPKNGNEVFGKGKLLVIVAMVIQG
jgi:hypothetical protein